MQRTVRSDGPRFRGWGMVQKRRTWGPWRDTEEAAYADAMEMRRVSDLLPQRLPTLAEAMDLVRRHCRTKRKAGTLGWYDAQFRAIELLIPSGLPLVQIDRDAVDAFIEQRSTEVSRTTVLHNLRALGRCFAMAIERGWCLENPVRQVEKPAPEAAEVDWFTRAEVTAVLGAIDVDLDRDLVLLFVCTGIRRGEAVGALVRDVGLPRGELWVRNAKRERRVIPISPELAPALERMTHKRAPAEPLIAGGDPTVRRTFRRWATRLNEPRLHPHALRHTFATLLIQEGERIDVVKELLGHRSVSMVMRYLRQHGPDARRAVARLRLLGCDDERSSAPAEPPAS